MVKRIIHIGAFAACIWLLSSSAALCWDDDITHVEITKKAIKYDLFLSDYLLDYLNIYFDNEEFSLRSKSYEDVPDIEIERFSRLQKNRVFPVKGYTADELLVTGAEAEDYPNLPFAKFLPPEIDYFYYRFGSRASHHFHDPEDEDTPGLDNRDSLARETVEWVTGNLNDLSGISAANRAIGESPPSFGGEDVDAAIPRNYFSWKDARYYYRKALTSERSWDRSHYFALTFLALGHVMHLVEDMAVPSHTRNDFSGDHLYSKLTLFKASNLENYVETRKTRYIQKLEAGDIDPVSGFSLPAYWDNRGFYPGGLAEYSRDFLSRGTVFDKYDSPAPADCSLNIQSVSLLRNAAYMRCRTGGNETVDHMVRITATAAFEMTVNEKLLEESLKQGTLDDKCYEDYADFLVPRAVAYASAVLKHFFRGRLDASVNIDGTIRITNLSDEDMSGLFTLYRTGGASRRFPVDGGSWNYNMGPGETVTTPPVITGDTYIAGDQPLVLVFEGRLGNEENAVAARVFEAPNSFNLWEISYYNDNTRFLRESYPNDEYVACWNTWRRDRFLFSGEGRRSVHYLLSFYYNKSGGVPLFPENGLLSECSMVPEDRSIFTTYYQSPLEYYCSLFNRALGLIDNSCGDPTAGVVLKIRPGWEIGRDSPNYFFSDDMTWRELPIPAPVPYSFTLTPALISKEGVDDFLPALHPKLELPPEMVSPYDSYALFSIDIPPPGQYDVGNDRSIGIYGGSTWNFDYFRLKDEFTAPGLWDLDEVKLTRADGGNMFPAVTISDAVFGPGFYRSMEYITETGLRQNYWVYDPGNPFEADKYVVGD